MKPSINSYGKSAKGYYKPYFKEKYIGDANNIIFRSSWERTFMLKYCDTNDNIVRWSSEPFFIEYISPLDKRKHKYFVDFFVETRSGSKYLIEIKPNKNLSKPKLNENSKSPKKIENYTNELKTYYVNLAKWSAADEFCKNRGWEFKIFTEKELNLKL